MPWISYPLKCRLCDGTGKIKPLLGFNARALGKNNLSDCLQCRGSGEIQNKVFVNGEATTEEDTHTKEDTHTNHTLTNVSSYFDDNFVKEVEDKIKKLKPKKNKEVTTQIKEDYVEKGI